MPVNLNAIIDELVKSAPPGELQSVKKNLDTIVSQETLFAINKSIEKFVERNALVLSGAYIASHLNKDSNSTKYWDYIGKQKFNVDLTSRKAIDLEAAEPNVDYPSYFNELVQGLKLYGDNHYPSEFAFTVIPESDSSISLIIIGEKINAENFYTGRWKSVYTVSGNGELTGHVNLDIHYYEDGNVRLSFEEPIKHELGVLSASSILNLINNTENELTLKVVDQFNLLNQNSFKNLRRLLPVTKSKINWGKAIGTYKLGSDIVNQ